MATWTPIPNSSLEPGAPARSFDALALRDNPIAIAEGQPGAPRIVNAAITDGTIGVEKLQTGTAERDWVLARTAEASRGAVGTYALLKNTSQFNPPGGGQTAPGSALEYAVLDRDTGETVSAGNPPGTWRNMGAGTDLIDATTLFLRIS